MEKMADQQAELAIYNSNKDKIERAQQRYEHLKKFAKVVGDGLMNAEIIWVLMNIDMDRVKNRNHFDNLIDQYKYAMQMCNRRMVIHYSVWF